MLPTADQHDPWRSLQFPLTVTYDESVESLTDSIGCSYRDPRITSANFPTMRTGVARVVLRLLQFSGRLRVSTIVTCLLDDGLRPAELREVLALAACKPTIVTSKLPVVSLLALRHGRRHWDAESGEFPMLSRYVTPGAGIDLELLAGAGGRPVWPQLLVAAVE
jgi:hypothetical protein